jgi:thymidylate synthase (FAD)
VGQVKGENVGQLVKPKVYLIGYTTMDAIGMRDYLRESGNEDFHGVMDKAFSQGVQWGEILCSFYAKLCYRSLTLGHNKNLAWTRDIPANIKACFDQGHGSVFEHCTLNFVVRNCSRVYEVELVRHRAGTAFSVESGRYVRGDNFDFVFDPILEPVKDEIEELQAIIEERYQLLIQRLGLDQITDITHKKRLTSALRRILPEGKAKDVGFSVNIRALRHIVQIRTSRHAEWEIREVFGQVYRLAKAKFPLLFYGAKEEEHDGLVEVSGMKLQPYEKIE